MKLLILILFMSLLSFNVKAGSKVYDRDIIVKTAETKVFDLGESNYVKNIFVQAIGLRSSTTVDVYVENRLKGTIHAPEVDPSYFVPINEKTRHILFRNIEGGDLKILSIVVNFKDGSSKRHVVRDREFKRDVMYIAKRTINLVDELRLYTTLDEESKYLMPIKLSAGQLKIMSMAHGDISYRTLTELENLHTKIKEADEFLSELMQKPILFDLVVELLTVKEVIVDMFGVEPK